MHRTPISSAKLLSAEENFGRTSFVVQPVVQRLPFTIITNNDGAVHIEQTTSFAVGVDGPWDDVNVFMMETQGQRRHTCVTSVLHVP